MSALPTLLSVPHGEDHILVRVVPRSSSSNSRPLDLDMTATDGNAAYVLRLQQSKISRYRKEASSLSDKEWESYLTSLLLGTQPIGQFHISARFNKDNSLVEIDIGNKVSGFTNTAGTLPLKYSNSATHGPQEVRILDWANEAILRQAQLAEELAELKLKHGELHDLVSEETAHIKALERSKHDFESEHNSFFRDLLNEKKLKIRTQEQILSVAHVDEAKLAALNVKAKSRTVGSSRKGKRKAESPGHDTDDYADKMEIDEQSESPDQELSNDEQTTDDEETASEPRPDIEMKPEPESKNPTRSSGGKKAGERYSPSASKAAAKYNKPPSSNLRGKSPVVATGDGDEDMPAPRALPFERKAKPIPDSVDDESTASE
ncbi:hypothetical protein diail_9755 [Diaporthe ilicicola]|nr:hypothetical protein diail_9755 [Diaporthe ilicicola]